MATKLVFGDPASIAARDKGREDWIRTQVECPECGAKGDKPGRRKKYVECDECGHEHDCSGSGEIRQILVDGEQIKWECEFCWERFYTDLDGKVIETLEVVE